MRIRNIITLLLLSLLATACNTDKGDAEGVVPTPVELVIRASQGVTTRASVVEDPEIVVGADLATADLAADPVAPDTRTELGDVGNGSSGSEQSIFWSVGDKLKLWAKPTETNASYVMSGTTFTMATYNADFDNADFMATLSSPMAKNTYNYYGVYPEPAEIFDTTNVSYTIPVSQNGAYNPTLDVMTAVTSGRELAHRTDMHPTIGTTEEPRLSFSHLFHLIRIHIPSGGNSLGSPIKRLILIFPDVAVGKVSFNVAQLGDSNFDITKQEYASWTETSNRIVIDLPDEQTLDANGRYVWLHVKPGAQSGQLRMRVCSENGVISQEASAPIDKTMQPQHITPISLTVPQSDESANIEVSFSCPDNSDYPNFLGEAASTMYVKSWPNTVTPIKSQGTTISGTNGVFKAKFYYLNNNEYQFNTTSNGATMSASFASAHANVSHNVFDGIVIPNFSTSTTSYYALPYLFFEDFASVGDISSNDAYDSGSVGASKNAVSFLSGWTGARIGASAGKSIRIASRRETSADYPARVDSAPLSRITSSTDIAITYNYGMDRMEGGLGELPNLGQTVLPGYVTSNEAYKSGESIYVWLAFYGYQNFSAIDGNFAEGDRFEVNETGGSYDYTPHLDSYKLSGRGSNTRLTWANVNKHEAGTTNGTFWLYIDNVRVSVNGDTARHYDLTYRNYFPNHTN